MRFLFVSHSRPYPPTNGGNQRTALLLRALKELGDVDLLLMHGDHPPDAEDLRRIGEDYNVLACVPMPRRGERPGWRWLRPLHPRLTDRVAAHLGRDTAHYAVHPPVAVHLERALAERPYDLLVGRYLRPTAASGALGYAPLALDVDDLDYGVWRTRLDVPSTSVAARAVFRHHVRQLRRIVPRLLARCERIWVANAADQAELRPLPSALLPNIPYLDDGDAPVPLPPCPGSRTLLTVASLLQERNREGIEFFISQVWPQVRVRVPDATFQIVGSHMTATLRERWGATPGVDPVGFVDDLREAYTGCAFTVSPLFYGGGSNIKVLESLAHGRTCVATPFSARGFEGTLSHGVGLYVGEGAAGLAEACVTLLESSDLARDLAARGAEIVAERYSYERFRDCVHEGVRAAVQEGGVRPRGLASGRPAHSLGAPGVRPGAHSSESAWAGSRDC